MTQPTPPAIYAPYIVIKTKEDWWKAVDTHWHNFKLCADKTRMAVTPEIEKAKTDRNWQVVYRLLQEIWMRAPDVPGVRSWPSWTQLCDCCSEVWVFEEPEA